MGLREDLNEEKNCTVHKDLDVTCTARMSFPRDKRFCNGNTQTVWTRRTSNMDGVRLPKQQKPRR